MLLRDKVFEFRLAAGSPLQHQCHAFHWKLRVAWAQTVQGVGQRMNAATNNDAIKIVNDPVLIDRGCRWFLCDSLITHSQEHPAESEDRCPA